MHINMCTAQYLYLIFVKGALLLSVGRRSGRQKCSAGARAEPARAVLMSSLARANSFFVFGRGKKLGSRLLWQQGALIIHGRTERQRFLRNLRSANAFAFVNLDVNGWAVDFRLQKPTLLERAKHQEEKARREKNAQAQDILRALALLYREMAEELEVSGLFERRFLLLDFADLAGGDQSISAEQSHWHGGA